MVARRAAGEPLQYVLGRWGFRTLDLLVDRRVLIPRPETEVVAGPGRSTRSAALDRPGVAVDLGTGSGAIALSLAAERWPDVEVWATDVSPTRWPSPAPTSPGSAAAPRPSASLEGDRGSRRCPATCAAASTSSCRNPPYVAADDDAARPRWPTGSRPPPSSPAPPASRRSSTSWPTPRPGWRPDGVLVVEIGDDAGRRRGARWPRPPGSVDPAIHPDLAGATGRSSPVDRFGAWTADQVDEVVAALAGGGVVVLPTDTVYGLVALASDAAADDSCSP